VEIREREISRHVVRFVCDDGTLYMMKELSERLARREYRLLRALAELNIPAVEVVGIAADRDMGDAILVTRYLSNATTYRAVFAIPRGGSLPTGCWTRWPSCLGVAPRLLRRIFRTGTQGLGCSP
jgi:hypothetical protein